VLNEYIDLDVDRRSPDLFEKPLVKGTVTPEAALAVVIGSMAAAYGLTLVYFMNIWTLILLSLSFCFGAIYDVLGKRFAGSDFTLALWMFFFCLYGASIVSLDFTNLLYLVAFLGFFQILFNNAIEGGLKDSDHDAIAGARTLAHSLGVRVKNNKFHISKAFKFSSYLIKMGYLTIVVLIIFLGTIKIVSIYDYLQLILLIILIIIILTSQNRFLNTHHFRRDKLKRIFSVHEIATFYIAPILLLQLIGLPAVIILLLLPLGWYLGLNLILYGRPLEPKV
jgi:4-hydroxybenzoate polyprenyltransferase